MNWGQRSIFKIRLNQVELTNLDKVQSGIDFNPIIYNFKPAKILVADDNQLNREFLKCYLELFPFEVLEAKNGEEAIEIAKQEHPDLILMDIKMPKVDGILATKQIRANPKTATIPVITISASAMKEEIPIIKKISEKCLTKPIPIKDLVSEICEYLPHTINENLREEQKKKTIEILDKKNLGDCLTELFQNDLEKFNNIKNLLMNQLSPLLKEIRESHSIEDMEEFGKKILELSSEFDIPRLKDFGDTLTAQVSAFDMESLEESYMEFDRMKEAINKVS